MLIYSSSLVFDMKETYLQYGLLVFPRSEVFAALIWLSLVLTGSPCELCHFFETTDCSLLGILHIQIL